MTEVDVEKIILHAAYTEDKVRMRRWLKKEFPKLPDGDVSYILRQKLKEFGRLSRKLLTGIVGTEKESYGEAFTIMQMLWDTNCKLLAKPHSHGREVYWNGETNVARIKKIVAKNAVHLTRFAFFRKGGLFDQQPVKAAEGLVPLKKDLPTEVYGGYNKATASCFIGRTRKGDCRLYGSHETGSQGCKSLPAPGQCLFRLKNYSEAIADLTEEIRLKPSYKEAYQDRAKVYRTIGKEALAQADEDQAANL